jgi:hypothetical protein
MDDGDGLRALYPDVVFIDVPGHFRPEDDDDPAAAHLIYDRRRTAGLAYASGDIIAITEDHVIPGRGWCRTIADLHTRLPYGAIGGALDSGSRSALNRAVYYCDFSRYQNPVPEGPAAYITDVNVSYKRTALEQVRDVWKDYYHETYVHGAMQQNGQTLWLTPKLTASHDRGQLVLRRVLAERWSFARLFAARRARQLAASKRAFFLVASPLLPVVLTARPVIRLVQRRNTLWPLLSVLPIVFLLSCIAAAGECAGYATAHEKSRSLRRVRAVARASVRDWDDAGAN